jgi:hypothetical protein
MDRVLTRKGAVVELAIVTVGVLIALSFDGVRGWMRERSLVDAARANLTTELGANKKAVEGFLKTIAARQQELDTVRGIGQTLMAGQPITLKEAALNFGFSDINTAAYSTAQLTGAFGLMDYEDVREYAATYALQARFADMQIDAVEMLRDVLSRTWVIEDEKPPLREVELWLQDINRLDAHLLFLGQFGSQLVEGYDNVLTGGD